MKNTLLLCLAFLTIGNVHAQPGSLLENIPSDADQVYHVNLASLGSKLDWQALMHIAQGHNLGQLHAMNLADFNAIFNSGIDFHSDIVIAISKADSTKYTTIVAHLTDSGKFVNALRSKFKDFHNYHLAGSKERVATVKDNVFGWNSRIVVIVLNKNPAIAVPAPPYEMQNHTRAARRCVAELHGVTDSKFVTDPRLTAVFSDDADVHIWNRKGVNVGNLGNMFQNNPAASQMGAFAQMFPKANQDPTIGELRFEAGRIVYRNLKLITPAERTYLERLNSPGLSNEIPAAVYAGGRGLMGVVTVHYNIPMALDTFRKSPAAGMMESTLKEKGLTLQDLANAFKGDMALLVYAPDKTTADTGKKKPAIYLLATIDKAAFIKVAPTLKLSDADATSADPSADTAHHGMLPYYSTKNDLLVLGADRRRVNSFFGQPAADANPSGGGLIPDRASSNMFNLGIDMHALTAYLTIVLTKGDTIAAKDQRLLDGLGKMAAIQMSIGAVSDKGMESYYEVRMTDQAQNALTGLLGIIADLSKKPDGSPQKP